MDEQDANGNTPLLMAVMFGHKRVVEILVDHGANLNAKPPGGMTPLTLAALRRHADVATFLRAHGGKP